MSSTLTRPVWFDDALKYSVKDKENLIKDGTTDNDLITELNYSYSDNSSSASTTPTVDSDKLSSVRLDVDHNSYPDDLSDFEDSPKVLKVSNSSMMRSIKDRKKRRLDEDDEDYTENPVKKEILSPQPVKVKRSKISDSQIPDSLNVDITELLSLPQKEAASKLGISESMLCKRFKECTRRKWPYRYLRKIEKTIKNLEGLKKAGNISPQDESRLEEFLEQRRECLAPVKIRITNHDRLPAFSLSTHQPYTYSSLSNDSCEEDIDSEEDNFAVETLGLLRSLSPKE